MTAVKIRDQIRRGERTAEDVTLEHLDRIDTDRNAFITVMRDEALAQAKRVDAKKNKGLLAGVPVAVKDNICVQGVRTTCGSRILENYLPPYSATVIERLREADAVVIGKTNLDEFGMGSSTERSAFGSTKNPHDPSRVPGGSSGGSAAAVAAGEAVLALGSDTGGSVRQPAAFCGTVGFKPTYGRVSRYGLVAFASSLDQIGPLARTVEEIRLFFEVIQGADPLDATSRDLPWEYQECDIGKLRIGVPDQFFGSGLDVEVESIVRSALEKVTQAGARQVETTLSTTDLAVPAYYVVAPCEASSNLARFDGVHYGRRSSESKNILDLYTRSRGEGFGAEVTRRILLGTFALSSGYYDAYYNHALKVRRLIKQDFESALRNADVIVSPTTPTAAFEFGAKTRDPLSMYLCDIYTVAANLAGLPAISIPCGKTASGLPVGIQLIGKAFDDSGLLAAAAACEKAFVTP